MFFGDEIKIYRSVDIMVMMMMVMVMVMVVVMVMVMVISIRENLNNFSTFFEIFYYFLTFFGKF